MFGLYGCETGYTLEEAKTVIKRENPFMIYEKGGRQFLKSTADLSKDEMQYFIDWMRDFAAADGIYLPSSDEYLENQHTIDKQLENRYL